MIKTFLYFIGFFVVVVVYDAIMCTVVIVKLSKQGNQIDFL